MRIHHVYYTFSETFLPLPRWHREKQRRLQMKLFVLSTVIGATLLGALPASAQIVIRDRDDAVVVRHMDRDHMDRGRHEGWWNHRADCRVVRVRTRLSNGDVIVRSRRTCD